MTTIPEECKLVAARVGGGWSLEVHNVAGEVIGFLAWPASWPTRVTTAQLKSFGFEVV